MSFILKAAAIRAFIISTAIAVIWPSIADSETASAWSDSAYVDCEQPPGPVAVGKSPNQAHFQKLLAVGKKAPLAAFMKLWYPDRRATSASHPLFEKCLRAHASCEGPLPIDTVYSWGPAIKVKALEKAMPDGGIWKGPPNPGYTLNTLVSAIGSYGYGQIPVRIKIKPQQSSSSPIKVWLRSDYQVTDANEVESWSYGTPEHYDEIIRDLKRFISGQPWIGYSASTWEDTDDDRLFFEGLDGHDFTDEALKASLLEMIRMILSSEGRIHYAQGQCRNRALEFQTHFPTYFNPFQYSNTYK